MNLPVVGHITVQGMLLLIIWGACCLYGFTAGFKRCSQLLTASVLALAVAVVPQINSFVTDLISVVISKRASHVAYLLVFVCMFIALRFLFYRLPKLLPMSGRPVDKALGLLSGLVMGFVYTSMFMVLLYTVRLPIKGLYDYSDIAAFLGRCWSEMGLLGVLYYPQYLNPANWL